MKKLVSSLLLLSGLVLLLGTGCTKKPSPEELNQLSSARQAAESAEQKLQELRSERASLESDLDAKKEELRKTEEERDAIKAKLGN